MKRTTTTIPISSIILDESIYPRDRIDRNRVGIFAANIRDGFTFDPIEVEPVPGRPSIYRILDGAHRWSAYKAAGITEIAVIIRSLDGSDPLLYAAQQAIGPRQFTEEETKKTTRLAFINADWRDFQHRPAAEESHEGSILIDDYLEILQRTGWRRTHIIQAPLSTQRFSAGMVSAMQKRRILGVTSRYVIILKRQ